MQKNAVVFNGPEKPFSLRAFPILPPAAGQAGLTLVSSGICGTDVHIHEGFLGMPDMPLILGHEFIGKIDALGDSKAKDGLGNPLAVGDTAIACVAIPCGKCFNCRRGETASCLSFGVTYVKSVEEPPHFHGGYGEYLFSPLQNLVRLPETVNPMAAAAFPCGGPTVIRAFEYGGGTHEGELVVVQGNGSVGLFALAWAKAHGCQVAVIGSAANAERLKLTQTLQPDRFFDFRKTAPDELRKAIAEMAVAMGRGDGADTVIETSGSPQAFPLGLSLLRTRGRYLVPGQYSDRGPVSIEPHLITFRALQVIGSGQYTMQDLKTYVDFLATHPELQPIFAQMLSKYSLKEADKAFADAKAGKTIKAVFC